MTIRDQLSIFAVSLLSQWGQLVCGLTTRTSRPSCGTLTPTTGLSRAMTVRGGVAPVAQVRASYQHKLRNGAEPLMDEHTQTSAARRVQSNGNSGVCTYQP